MPAAWSARLDQVLILLRPLQVGDHLPGPGAAVVHFAAGLVRLLLQRLAVMGNDLHAFLGKGDGKGAADPLAGAGDERDLSLQAVRGPCSGRADDGSCSLLQRLRSREQVDPGRKDEIVHGEPADLVRGQDKRHPVVRNMDVGMMVLFVRRWRPPRSRTPWPGGNP